MHTEEHGDRVSYTLMIAYDDNWFAMKLAQASAIYESYPQYCINKWEPEPFEEKPEHLIPLP